jgi:aminomethyltransferase
VPWHFGDFDAEYRAIRSSAALFDHTAVGLTRLTGDVIPLLQQVLARDVEFLTPERCMMTLMLADDGEPIDLLTVYSFDDYVLLESSHGRQHAAREHLAAHSRGDGNVEIKALDGEWGMLGVEGPYSWGALGRVLDPAITALPYGSVLELDIRGTPVVFSRNGFTGEYGYKLIGPSDIISELWTSLLAQAAPAGQRALQTAMLEVRQPVLHRDCPSRAGIVPAGLQWLTDPMKSEFTGRVRLMAELADRESRRVIGICWTGPDSPAGAEVLAGENVIGDLVAAEYSPGLGKRLGLAMVDRDLAAAGLALGLRPAGQGTGEPDAEAVSLAPPYVVPTSWTTPIL